jgi:uncharacterized protein
MQFNVSTLLKEHTGSTREYAIDDDLRLDGEKHHLTGHVRLDRTHDGVLVRAKLSGSMSGECSRCLKPISYPIDLQIEEEYLPSLDINTGAAVEPPEGQEDAYRINARHVLDLSQAAAQYWALALPMAPLCDEGCAGLCPLCGEEIAVEGHKCTREQVDARWSKLAQLELG